MLDVATDKSAVEDEELQREVYNAAFYELGLAWNWDVDTYRRITAGTTGIDPVRLYLETEQAHLLKVYDAAFLAQAIEAAKARCYEAMQSGGICNPPRLDWTELHRVQVGV
jgi:hypothetical protein